MKNQGKIELLGILIDKVEKYLYPHGPGPDKNNEYVSREELISIFRNTIEELKNDNGN